jgi:hypothetical protein
MFHKKAWQKDISGWKKSTMPPRELLITKYQTVRSAKPDCPSPLFHAFDGKVSRGLGRHY